MWWFLLAAGVLWVMSLCGAWGLCTIGKRADEAVREHGKMSGLRLMASLRAISAPITNG
jgi:hypothetical protein